MEDTEPNMVQARRSGKWFLAGLLSTGVVLLLCFGGKGNLNAQKAKVQRAVRFDMMVAGTENADQLPSCSWATDSNWYPLTSADERAIPAVNASFALASAKRKGCHPALGELDF